MGKLMESAGRVIESATVEGSIAYFERAFIECRELNEVERENFMILARRIGDAHQRMLDLLMRINEAQRRTAAEEAN